MIPSPLCPHVLVRYLSKGSDRFPRRPRAPSGGEDRRARQDTRLRVLGECPRVGERCCVGSTSIPPGSAFSVPAGRAGAHGPSGVKREGEKQDREEGGARGASQAWESEEESGVIITTRESWRVLHCEHCSALGPWASVFPLALWQMASRQLSRLWAPIQRRRGVNRWLTPHKSWGVSTSTKPVKGMVGDLSWPPGQFTAPFIQMFLLC